MVTIHNLEVRFDIEGEGDEAVFGRLFQKYMRIWRRSESEQQQRSRMAERDRSLGDRGSDGDSQ
ncbi:MAG: hypothetical protein GY906_13985 [bacterium]|nr:hypothetical protein [bacterium]